MSWQDQLQALKPMLGTATRPRPAKPPRKVRIAPKPKALPIIVEPVTAARLAELHAHAEGKRLDAEREAKRMALPTMTQAFTTPYTIERQKSHSTPIEFKQLRNLRPKDDDMISKDDAKKLRTLITKRTNAEVDASMAGTQEPDEAKKLRDKVLKAQKALNDFINLITE